MFSLFLVNFFQIALKIFKISLPIFLTLESTKWLLEQYYASKNQENKNKFSAP